MNKLHLSYLPATLLRVAEKRSFVPRQAAFFRACPRAAAMSASKNLRISLSSLRRFTSTFLLF